MKHFLFLFFLLYSIFLFGQKKKITFLDCNTGSPIFGVKALTDNGQFIGNTDLKGEINIDFSWIENENIKKLFFEKTDYTPIEIHMDSLKDKPLCLNKKELIKLPSVVAKGHHKKKYYLLKGYVRSWQIIDGKLAKYGDALVEYLYPYNKDKKNIKKNIIAYRTYKIKGVKNKSTKFNISFGRNLFLDPYISKKSRIDKFNFYSTTPLNDSLRSIQSDNKNVDFAYYNKENKPLRVFINEGFDEEDNVKIGLWKASYKNSFIENWSDSTSQLFPTYIFYNRKNSLRSKNKEIKNVETVNEIFILDKIFNENEKTANFKTVMDKDYSYYDTHFWEPWIEKYPLPENISNQLININENPLKK